MSTVATRPEVIFFGNGPLADFSLEILSEHCDIIFHARTKDDLEKIPALKQSHPDAFGILASFGVFIPSDLLTLFAPEGILNLHPSLLPRFRGASPIESAILAGDTDFSYSIMQLAAGMDAGPIYHQETLSGLPLEKTSIYRALAHAGASWLVNHLAGLRSGQLTPVPQDSSAATFCSKLDKSLSPLDPSAHSAAALHRQVIAYQGYPKPKYAFFEHTCIILEAHVSSVSESPLSVLCADGQYLTVDQLQPEGKRPMPAQAFLNGYHK